MGHISDLQNPEVQETIDTTLARIQQRGRVAGTLAFNENVEKYAAAGVQFLMTTTAPWLSAGAKAFRAWAEKATPSS